MGARIRGHYRIDAAGRVEAVCDVNSSLQSYVYQPPVTRSTPAERRAWMLKGVVGAVSLACVGLILMASLPQIQNAVVAADASRFARRAAHIRSNFSASPDHHWNRPGSDQ